MLIVTILLPCSLVKGQRLAQYDEGNEIGESSLEMLLDVDNTEGVQPESADEPLAKTIVKKSCYNSRCAMRFG